MKKIYIALLVAATFAGCSEDFLDRASLTQIDESNFWRSESDAYLALNAVYSTLQSRVLYGGNLSGAQGYPGYDNIGDNAFNQFKWEGPGIYMEGTIDPTHFWFGDHWTNLYQGIARVNAVVFNLENMDEELISQEVRRELIGQAYFLRALFYFNLAVYYEDVPLITQPQALGDAFVPKNTYDEIIAQVNTDLNYAIDHLPESYPADLYGYATKGAALGLKARVQLYNQSYTGAEGVLELTNQLLTLGYSLHPDYNQLFSLAGEYSDEIIFSIRFLRGDDTNNGEIFSGTFQGTPKVDQRPMPNLVDDYYCTDGLPIDESPLYDPANKGQNRDPRANATIYFAGDTFLIDLQRVFPGNGPTRFGMKKYIRQSADSEGNPVFGEGSQDFYAIRYADVLLMRAEAMAETGDLTGAAALVNQVRDRAGMPHVEDVEGAVDQAQMIEIVRHERRVELALEGLRFTDLKRWDAMEEAYDRAVNDPVGPFNPQYLGKRSEVFPIPQSEIDVNPLLTQHPAWL
jgi:hypothetical protein